MIRVNELLLETSILLQIRCCTRRRAHLLCFSTPTASTPVQKSVESSGPSRGGAQGDEQGLGMTWHCARGERDGEPPAGAGREHGGRPRARWSAVGS